MNQIKWGWQVNKISIVKVELKGKYGCQIAVYHGVAYREAIKVREIARFAVIAIRKIVAMLLLVNYYYNRASTQHISSNCMRNSGIVSGLG